MSNNQALVLIYHRVDELSDDPQLLSVSQENFDKQIKYLKDNYNIISLQELVKGINNKNIPDKAVVITFDDGYKDNLYKAKPILEKYNAPATIFITSGMIGSNKEYWWDELEKIFLLADNLPQILELEVKNKKYNWKLCSYNDKLDAYNQIHHLIKYLPDHQRALILEYLYKWSDADKAGREGYLSVNESELVELAKGDLIEIGAHTVSHCVLKCEDVKKQQYEITKSKEDLEAILNKEILSFSYPFGGPHDAGKDARKIAKKANFNCGIANIPGNASVSTDLYWVPRRLIRNWDLEEFVFHIENFQRKTEKKYHFLNKHYEYNLLPRVRKYNHSKEKIDKLENILQISTIDCVGGAAKVANRIHNKLNEQEYSSKMLVRDAFSKDPNVEEFSKKKTIKSLILNNNEKQKGWLDFSQLASLNINQLDIFKESQLLHFHNLHGYYFNPFILPGITSKKPAVWTLHDMQSITGHCAHSFDCNKWAIGCNNCESLKTYPAIKKDSASFLWNNKKLIYQYSDLTVVCPSLWLKKKVDKSILKDKDVRLIYNGIDETIYKNYDKTAIRKELGLPEDKIILMFSSDSGVKNIWKGGEYLIRAYKHLSSNKDLLFVNLGGKKSENKENWITIPYIHDETTVAKYYSAADLFIYPSLADNCPLVVLESLSCGTPIVAFNTGGIPELIQHNETGYISEYKNLEDFISGIKHFIDNEEFRTKASISARQSVEKDFTLNKMVDDYIKLYLEITGN